MAYASALVCVAVTSIFIRSTIAATFDCYVCTYTRSSDPTVTYECVNEGVNASTIRPCQTPFLCKTITLFNQDMSHIRSVTRDCLPQVDNCAGDGCCNMAGVYPLCEQKCRGNNCNTVNPEKWLKAAGGDGDTAGDNNNGGSNTGTSVKSRGVDGCVFTFAAILCMIGRVVATGDQRR